MCEHCAALQALCGVLLVALVSLGVLGLVFGGGRGEPLRLVPERGLCGDALVDLPVHPAAHLQLCRLRQRYRSHRVLWGKLAFHIHWEISDTQV